MREPLVSVVTVCYNAVTTIENTILSVLKQSYENIEYIIVDGGSKDGTIDIINKYKNRLAVFISEKDNGIYDAMNKGIKAATGEWIIFRNSGDYFASENVVSEMFADKVDDDVIVLHGDCRIFDQYGYRDEKPYMLSDEYYPTVMPVFHPSSFIRLSYHKKHYFDLRFRSSSDFDFFTRCTLARCRYEYRPILVSVMNAGEGMSVDNLKTVYKENYSLLCENGVLENTLKSKMKYFAICYNMRFRNWLKKWLPMKYVKLKIIKNKQKTGWVMKKNSIPDFIRFEQ